MPGGLNQDDGYIRCRHCNSDDVARSRTRGAEGLLRFIGIRPYRCLLCSRRFFGSMRLAIKVEQEGYQWS
jgi:DNA-directed RNA polymerase subunit RPC12/RpoP